MTRLLASALFAAALIGAASANAEPVSGADLVRELSDNTLTGYNGSLWFSEYHAPDGRVFGHNGSVRNEDSCWRVREDAVCYYYPRNRLIDQDARTEFCWRFERAGTAGYKISPVGSSRGGIARLEPGNERNHTDNGRAWTCEALMSRREWGQPTLSYAALLGAGAAAFHTGGSTHRLIARHAPAQPDMRQSQWAARVGRDASCRIRNLAL